MGTQQILKITDFINTSASGVWETILNILSATWWVLLPLGLFFIFRDSWKMGMNYLWKKDLKWVLLEIKIPKEILKTPKAMENVFSALHGLYTSDPDWEDIYFKGDDLKWFSLEIVGYAGKVHFYIRTLQAVRNLVESAIYSEYPDAEVTEVEDYVEAMPDILPNEVYDIWGNNFVLSRSDENTGEIISAYPIKTYEFFEANVEEQRLDPVAAITEVMSRLNVSENEAIWLQYLIRPVGNKWKEQGEKIRDKMMERKKDKPKNIFAAIVGGFFEFLTNLGKASVEYPVWGEEVKKEEKTKMLYQSPGEKNILEAVEKKSSKLGFGTLIRFIYIDRRDSFSQNNVVATRGAFKQFNTIDLNGFKMDSNTVTNISPKKFKISRWGIFRKPKINARKRQIYDLYRLRYFSRGRDEKLSILNTEELATVFHFPIITVGAPLLRRLETKKGEPPISLPIEIMEE